MCGGAVQKAAEKATDTVSSAATSVSNVAGSGMDWVATKSGNALNRSAGAVGDAGEFAVNDVAGGVVGAVMEPLMPGAPKMPGAQAAQAADPTATDVAGLKKKKQLDAVRYGIASTNTTSPYGVLGSPQTMAPQASASGAAAKTKLGA